MWQFIGQTNTAPAEQVVTELQRIDGEIVTSVLHFVKQATDANSTAGSVFTLWRLRISNLAQDREQWEWIGQTCAASRHPQNYAFMEHVKAKMQCIDEQIVASALRFAGSPTPSLRPYSGGSQTNAQFSSPGIAEMMRHRASVIAGTTRPTSETEREMESQPQSAALQPYVAISDVQFSRPRGTLMRHSAGITYSIVEEAVLTDVAGSTAAMNLPRASGSTLRPYRGGLQANAQFSSPGIAEILRHRASVLAGATRPTSETETEREMESQSTYGDGSDA
jgi:hypothetical protein